MYSNDRRSALAEIFATIGDAISAAAAVRVGRQPADRNLIALGIDPRRFPRVRR